MRNFYCMPSNSICRPTIPNLIAPPDGLLPITRAYRTYLSLATIRSEPNSVDGLYKSGACTAPRNGAKQTLDLSLIR